jgi:hypothetical protein
MRVPPTVDGTSQESFNRERPASIPRALPASTPWVIWADDQWRCEPAVEHEQPLTSKPQTVGLWEDWLFRGGGGLFGDRGYRQAGRRNSQQGDEDRRANGGR